MNWDYDSEGKLDRCEIPNWVAVCPECGKSLWVNIVEWSMAVTQPGPYLPSETGVETWCEDFLDCDGQTYRMPYVYWLPVELTVYRYVMLHELGRLEFLHPSLAELEFLGQQRLPRMGKREFLMSDLPPDLAIEYLRFCLFSRQKEFDGLWDRVIEEAEQKQRGLSDVETNDQTAGSHPAPLV